MTKKIPKMNRKKSKNFFYSAEAMVGHPIASAPLAGPAAVLRLIY